MSGAQTKKNEKRVLVIEGNEDIRTVLVAQVANNFRAQVISTTPREACSALSSDEFSLVISDVEGPKDQEFWLPSFLKEHHPMTKMILFVCPEKMGGRMPKVDSTVLSVVSKFEFKKLVHEIKKTGVLDDDSSK